MALRFPKNRLGLGGPGRLSRGEVNGARRSARDFHRSLRAIAKIAARSACWTIGATIFARYL